MTFNREGQVELFTVGYAWLGSKPGYGGDGGEIRPRPAPSTRQSLRFGRSTGRQVRAVWAPFGYFWARATPPFPGPARRLNRTSRASVESEEDAADAPVGDGVKQQGVHLLPAQPRAPPHGETPPMYDGLSMPFAPSAPSALIVQRSRSDARTRRARVTCRTCPCTCVLF